MDFLFDLFYNILFTTHYSDSYYSDVFRFKIALVRSIYFPIIKYSKNVLNLTRKQREHLLSGELELMEYIMIGFPPVKNLKLNVTCIGCWSCLNFPDTYSSL